MRIQRVLVAAQTLSLSVCLAPVALGWADPVNKDSKTIAGYEKRVADYLKLHNQARSGLTPTKATESPEVIGTRELELAEHIRTLRPGARQGTIFDASVRAEFRRLVNISSRGANGTHIRTSLARSEPVDVPIRVNGAYPKDMALQTTPSTLLQNLPPLPKELEYRVVGRKLVLRDIEANLIIDYSDDAVR